MNDTMMYDVNETPDDYRPSLSLNQFCRRAKELLNSDQTDFVQFVLTGRDSDGTQAYVDPILNFVGPENRLDVKRDYDSLLGICSDIKFKGPITVYPISKFDDTLSRSKLPCLMFKIMSLMRNLRDR